MGRGRVTTAAVNLWGREIGAVTVAAAGDVPVFQYRPEFARGGVQLSPLRMPLRERPYRFAALGRDEAFEGLPGLLSDSLPDRWGRTLIDAWLDAQGRSPESFDVVERLCYVGTRGIGALEFQPAVDAPAPTGADLRVDRLVELAATALERRDAFTAELTADPGEDEMRAILTLGTSAGGARPKAVIAFNETTGQVRSGQVDPGPGFRHWLLKFDGVGGAGDHGLNDPRGWGAIEFAYWRMARMAGIDMMESRLLDEHGRRHFMTRRFDRPDAGGKLHVQTLGALEHVSYNAPGAYSYERAFMAARALGLETPAVEALFRRMVFNIVARNQDDHVKNISFLMGRDGRWRLAPAYDLTFAFAPGNRWLQAHQMTVNGRRDDFSVADLRAASGVAGLKRGRAERILSEVSDAVSQWPRIADEVGIDSTARDEIHRAHRLALPVG